MNYNRDKSTEYAHQWAHGRNPAYYDFSGMGGDCTNFISQCLYAGCGVMNHARDVGWYYTSPGNRAAAWSGVPYLHRFLTTNKQAGPYAAELPIKNAQPGDIIQLSFDGINFGHSLFIVNIYPEILIATHSDDSDNRPLSTYRFQRARLIHIEGVRG